MSNRTQRMIECASHQPLKLGVTAARRALQSLGSNNIYIHLDVSFSAKGMTLAHLRGGMWLLGTSEAIRSLPRNMFMGGLR